jgi:hypothetical protein
MEQPPAKVLAKLLIRPGEFPLGIFGAKYARVELEGWTALHDENEHIAICLIAPSGERNYLTKLP